MGGVAGFVTARLYKTFKGKMWQRATLLTAFLYPGGFFAMFFLLDLASWIYGSSDAVPFWIMLVVVLLWFCVSTPLVFLGSYFGYKKVRRYPPPVPPTPPHPPHPTHLTPPPFPTRAPLTPTPTHRT